MSSHSSQNTNGSSNRSIKKPYFNNAGYDNNNTNNEYQAYTNSNNGQYGYTNVNTTPEQNTHGRRPSYQYMQHQYITQQQPQISVPATPRMLSGSSRHASTKKYTPQTPPLNNNQQQQFHSQFTQQQTLFNSNQQSYYNNNNNSNGSGETAKAGRILLSPSESLRRDRANFRNDMDTSLNMGSPIGGARRGSSDRKRYESSFDKFANDINNNNGNKTPKLNKNIPIIKINANSYEQQQPSQQSEMVNTSKEYNFIEAYEREHKPETVLMPPPAFSSQQQQSKTINNTSSPRQTTDDFPLQPPQQPTITNNTNNGSNNLDNAKITIVESGKKYKEFHRKSIGDWEFVQNIGSGSMGKVKVAKNVKTKDLCAVKIVTRAVKTFLYKCEKDPQFRNSLTKEEYKERLLKENSRDKRTIREGGLGQIFYHPNICRLFHIWALTTHYYMLFEYVQGGQLLDYIIQHGSLKEYRVRKFTRGIASAIKYLHGHNIVHRDLKIENILISDAGDIKIIDFGLSNFYNVNSQLKTFCGSLYFAAPELLKAEPYIGPEVDIWAFGIVMFVLLCGKVPFDNDRSDVLHKLIKEGNVEYPSHLSESVKSLLKRMIIVDRNLRYDIDEIIDHPWLNEGYDYKVISHIPARKPLTEIDIEVCEEMVRLAFFDNAETLKQSLTELIESDEYIHLAKRHYKMFGNEYPRNGEDDPLLAFHSNISLYHLIDEFYDRKDSNKYLDKEKVSAAMDSMYPNPKVSKFVASGKLNSPAQKVETFNKSIQNETISDEKISPQPKIITIPDYKNTNIRPPSIAKVEENKNPLNLQEQERSATTGLGLLSPVKPTYKQQKVEVGNDTPLPSPSTSENPNQEKFKFGSLFRRFSQSKRKPSNEVPPPNVVAQTEEKPWKRVHKRTVSEGVPTQHKRDYPSVGGGQRLPALPMNADMLVKKEQQRYNSVNDDVSDQLQPPVITSGSNTATGNNTPSDQGSTYSTTAQKRRLHPNARARSVGGNVISDFIKTGSSGSSAGFIDDKTVDQIMREAANAPKNSMPSIEYPKVFFLKNFFSVQTTSFLPLPVVRYEIIKTLRHMNIQYREIPGAFVCTHSNQPLPNELVSKNDTLEDITSAYYDDNNNTDDDEEEDEDDENVVYQTDTGKNNLSRRGSVMRKAYKEQIPQTPKISSNWNYQNSIANTPKSPPHVGDISLDYDETYDSDDDSLRKNFEGMNIDNQYSYNRSSKSRMMITDDSKPSSNEAKENGKVVFEIHIVKVPVIGTAGVHFKKISGNTWNYKTLATNILNELKL
mgnify:CR=1 FL=1